MGCLHFVSASGIRQPVLTYSLFTFHYYLKNLPASVWKRGWFFIYHSDGSFGSIGSSVSSPVLSGASGSTEGSPM